MAQSEDAPELSWQWFYQAAAKFNSHQCWASSPAAGSFLVLQLPTNRPTLQPMLSRGLALLSQGLAAAKGAEKVLAVPLLSSTSSRKLPNNWS